MIALRRHMLVWLSEAPATDNASDTQRAHIWQALNRPFVVTRRRGDGPEVGVGFCTTDPAHPELRPRRVAARIAPSQIVRVARPPGLREIAECPAADTCRNSISKLLVAATREGVDIRVYGSWMWQALTGERHVHEQSDLDVLIDVASAKEADRAAAFLEEEETGGVLRIDGELSFARHGEVNWREYLQGKPEILLKAVDHLGLTLRSTLDP